MPPPSLKGAENVNYRVMRIDPRSVTPDAVTFAGDTLTINLPQRTYVAGCPYFVRLVDEIPAATTIGAAVEVTIGTGTVTYPLLDACGGQVTAERRRTGYSYPVTVVQSAGGGAFKLLAKLCYSQYNAAFSVDGTAAEGGDGA